MNKKNCANCAWFCHADGKCYGSWTGDAYEIPNSVKESGCRFWSADGLTDEERADLYPQEALMTMETIA